MALNRVEGSESVFVCTEQQHVASVLHYIDARLGGNVNHIDTEQRRGEYRAFRDSAFYGPSCGAPPGAYFGRYGFRRTRASLSLDVGSSLW